MVMHPIRPGFTLFFLLFISAYCSAQNSIEVSGKLPVMQEFRSDNHSEMSGEGRIWVSYFVWGDILERLMHNVASGKISIFDNNDIFLSIHQLWDTTVYLDTMIETDVEGNTITVMSIDSDQGLAKIGEGFDGLQFKEKWTLVPGGQIQKKIVAFSPLGQRFRRFPKLKPGELLGNDEPVFWLHPGPAIQNYNTIEMEQRVDLAELHNANDSATIVSYLRNGLMAGAIKAFKVDDKDQLLSIAEIDKKINPGHDTVQVWNPVNQQYDISVQQRIRNIDYIQFREQWMVDAMGNLTIRVKDYKLICRYFDSTGTYLGIMSLLWIKNE